MKAMKNLEIRIDNEADAAYLPFKDIGPGESKERIPVTAPNGDVIAVLDLSETGKILGVEFLNVSGRFVESFLEGRESDV